MDTRLTKMERWENRNFIGGCNEYKKGTTFTYKYVFNDSLAALDGTTFTFTQQDSNTTYPLASSSSNGLMSSSDKKKLDSMKTASVSGTTLIL